MYTKTKKYRMYNPIMLNASHIKHLNKLLKLNTSLYNNIVVFGDDCKIGMQIPGVMNMKDLTGHMGAYRPFVLKYDTMVAIYRELLKYTDVSDDVKREHVEYVKSLKKYV